MHEIGNDETRGTLREQLRRYLELRAEHGADRAREMMLEGFPERQTARLGPLMGDATLAGGLRRALPWLEMAGLVHEVVDDSGHGEDTALEITLTCTCLTAADELGIDAAKAEPLLCDLEVEATRRAFPDLRVESLCHQTNGGRVCVFRYSRTAR